jgi:uncharacterized OsmC-like protein
MKTKKSIKTALERKRRLLERRPDVGKGGVTTSIRVRDGLTCDIEEGPWKLTADMHPKSGGRAEGPTPGTFGRAALGSCLAITYMTWASYLDIPITDLEVTVEVTYDARGMYGFEEISPGYESVHYHVRVESPAPREEILRLIDLAERNTSYLDVFARPQPVSRSLEYVPTLEKRVS